MLPNFLVVGAAKSGTTSLYHHLKGHPEIYMSPVKEPYFFSFINKKPNFKGPYDQKVNEEIIYEWDKYENLFSGVSKEKAIGESSNSYLFIEESAYNIKKYIPNCKIIIILRNPIERAFSHYMQHVMIGQENLSFKEAINVENKRKKDGWRWHYQYIGQSMYYNQVKRYLDILGVENVHIIIFEQLKNKPKETIRSIYKFLNVDINFAIESYKKENRSGYIKYKWLWNLINNENEYYLKKALKFFTTYKFRAKLYKIIYEFSISGYTIDAGIKNTLKDFFQQDIIELQKLINIDLNHWLI